MSAAIQEAIRIVLETEGREGIEALRRALAGVGEVSAETVVDTERLLDSLAGLNETAAKATQFQQLGDDLDATTRALDEASRAALQLSLQIGETEKPSREMLRTYKDVRDEVARLEEVQKAQAAAQERVGADLRKAGIDTRGLAGANRDLRTQIQGTASALRQQVDSVQQQAAALRRQREATAEADEQFRRFARSSQVSAEALRKMREGADSAAGGIGNLRREAAQSEGVLGKLRGLAAPLLALLGFREAVQGAKNLADVAMQAEDARRSLQNLYGSQEAGNRAYERLKTLSEQNGIAFDVLVEQAKKLKAFGLDPLNGSMQALIDQNAAVGGSNEDLAGKVLALGQAWAKQKLQGEEILQLVERGVPVWDLLQKATGKNVDELQKLSSAGKLGRDVITALYQEMGRADAGAANRALGSMTGLVSQLSARWVEFRQKVVDAGVGEYFKRQLQDLLAATGGMDGLARRVSDGIVGTLESLKRFAQQVALVVKPIGAATLSLAKQAEAVMFLGKVYVALKLAQWAQGFAGLANSIRTTTAATGALTAAEAARAGGISRLGAIMAALPKVLTFSFLTIGLDVLLGGLQKLDEGLKARRESIQATQRLAMAEADLQREQLQLGRQLQSLYRDSAGTVIASAQQVSQLTRQQAQDYRAALDQARQYFGGVIREARAMGDAQAEATARTQWDALGQAIKGVEARLKELGRVAASDRGVSTFVNAAVAKFDELVAKGKAASAAINGAFDGLDLTSRDGMQRAVAVLDQVSARGTLAGQAVRKELTEALTKLSASDLPKVQAAADAAFGAGSKGAMEMAEQVNRLRLAKLGVDLDAIKTGMTAAGREVVTAFRDMVREIDGLGLDAAQRSTAIAQAFDNAFRQASTKQELQALREALQQALSAGDLGFAEFQQRIVETDRKLSDLAGTGQKLGDDVAAGASHASQALQEVEAAAGDAADAVDDAAASARESGTSMRDGSEDADAFALSLYSVSQRALEATMAANKLAGTSLFTQTLNRATARIDAQGKALDSEIEKLEAANAEFDEMAKRRKALAAQYDLLGDSELDRLIAAQDKLAANQERAAEARKREREEAERAAGGQAPAQAVEIARASTQAAAAAQSAAAVVDGARQAADAIAIAARNIPAQSGPIVIELRATGGAAGQPQLTVADINRLGDEISTVVMRRLAAARGLSRG